MDGYVQHAYVGNKTIVDIDESKSTFNAKDSRLTGKLEGTITKEYSGKTDRFSINLNSIPFYKDGVSPLAIFTTPSGIALVKAITYVIRIITILKCLHMILGKRRKLSIPAWS